MGNRLFIGLSVIRNSGETLGSAVVREYGDLTRYSRRKNVYMNYQ
jgi:hypothetical protein